MSATQFLMHSAKTNIRPLPDIYGYVDLRTPSSRLDAGKRAARGVYLVPEPEQVLVTTL